MHHFATRRGLRMAAAAPTATSCVIDDDLAKSG